MFSMPKMLIKIFFVCISVCSVPTYGQAQTGTWTDPETGLIWQRCSLGQTWTGSDCVGYPKEQSWSHAQQAVTQLGVGWRVPAVSELASLVRCDTGFKGTTPLPDRQGMVKTMPDECHDGSSRPTIDTTIFPNTPASGFWSASPFAYNRNNAWNLYFYNGYSNLSNKASYGFVRAVRSSR